MRPENPFLPAPSPAHPDRAGSSFARPDRSGLTLELVAPETLAPGQQARWARLSERSMGANIFALDWFMGAALHHCARGRRIRLGVVRQADGEWLGALPLTLAATIGRTPVPHWCSWRATNQFLGGPLVASGGEQAFWRALLAGLDRRPGAGIALMGEGLAADDATTLALVSVAAEEGRRLWIPRRSERPARFARSEAPQPSPALRKARSRLASLQRRLEREMGEVRVDLLAPGADPEDWIETFLALEKAGWKGSCGSALGCEPCNAALFRDTVREGHRRGHARLASLSVGERVLAMTTWFECSGRGFGFKMAHDETARRHAPGRLLMRVVAEDLAGDPGIAFDTCNGDGSAPDPLWPDRRQVVDCVVEIGSRGRRGIAAGAMGAAQLWRDLVRRRAAA